MDINGIKYGWSDIVFNIGGVLEQNVKSIEYATDQDKEEVYGAGKYPIGRGRGRVKTTGKISLGFEAIQRLKEKSPTRNLIDLRPFDIVVSYQPDNGGKIINDILKNVEFKKDATKWKEGDTSGSEDFDLMIQRVISK